MTAKPEYFGDGESSCPGCGAGLSVYDKIERHEDGRYWQSICWISLRCVTCGGARTRMRAGQTECRPCVKLVGGFPKIAQKWASTWSEATMDASIRRSNRRKFENFWTEMMVRVWIVVASMESERRWLYRGKWEKTWAELAVDAVKWFWWSRRWRKQWGRLAAHVRRDATRFVNRESWDSDDPSIRRFSQIEMD